MVERTLEVIDSTSQRQLTGTLPYGLGSVEELQE